MNPENFYNATIFGVTIFGVTIFSVTRFGVTIFGVPIFEMTKKSFVNLTRYFFVFCNGRVQRKNKSQNWRRKESNPRF